MPHKTMHLISYSFSLRRNEKIFIFKNRVRKKNVRADASAVVDIHTEK